VLVYATNGELGDACVEEIRRMTKDVEVGDTYKGRVVKTTTFGAFVELTKGTDGLLHISNLVPGGRAESVEAVVNRGDEVEVRVVEVNPERGRIGLRLADDPEIEGKSVEELSSIGTGNGGPSRGSRDRGRGGRDGRGGGRGRDRGRRGPRRRDD
jgi:polyribonucleotide nucleotidyltransferase